MMPTLQFFVPRPGEEKLSLTISYDYYCYYFLYLYNNDVCVCVFYPIRTVSRSGDMYNNYTMIDLYDLQRESLQFSFTLF